MYNFSDYVFVLWGEKFDEVQATIFVSELRKAGLRVKLVGLTARQMNGANDLALVPDLTLEQALPLANSTVCLIIPYTASGANYLKSDPRLCRFFNQAHINQAKFVMGRLNGRNTANLGLFSTTATDNITTYRDSENMVEFARELAGSLTNGII